MKNIPPARPRLSSASAILDSSRVWSYGGQHAETHGHSMDIEAVDALLWLAQLETNRVYFDAIFKFAAGDTELSQFVLHRSYPIAFLDPLVGDASNLCRARLCDGGENSGRQKGVGQSAPCLT